MHDTPGSDCETRRVAILGTSVPGVDVALRLASQLSVDVFATESVEIPAVLTASRLRVVRGIDVHDIDRADLIARYDAVVYAFDRYRGRSLGIPGESLPNVITYSDLIEIAPLSTGAPKIVAVGDDTEGAQVSAHFQNQATITVVPRRAALAVLGTEYVTGLLVRHSDGSTSVVEANTVVNATSAPSHALRGLPLTTRRTVRATHSAVIGSPSEFVVGPLADNTNDADPDLVLTASAIARGASNCVYRMVGDPAEWLRYRNPQCEVIEPTHRRLTSLAS